MIKSVFIKQGEQIHYNQQKSVGLILELRTGAILLFGSRKQVFYLRLALN